MHEVQRLGPRPHIFIEDYNHTMCDFNVSMRVNRADVTKPQKLGAYMIAAEILSLHGQPTRSEYGGFTANNNQN